MSHGQERGKLPRQAQSPACRPSLGCVLACHTVTNVECGAPRARARAARARVDRATHALPLRARAGTRTRAGVAWLRLARVCRVSPECVLRARRVSAVCVRCAAQSSVPERSGLGPPRAQGPYVHPGRVCHVRAGAQLSIYDRALVDLRNVCGPSTPLLHRSRAP
eukprot:6173811-Pleurochrysis_carterae.AAC.1